MPNQRAAFGRPSDVPGALTAGFWALRERVTVPPAGDKSPSRVAELWGFGALVAAAGLSNLLRRQRHRAPPGLLPNKGS